MTVLLGLVAALCVGTSDFLGGKASRTADPTAVTAFSSLVGFGLIGIVALVVGGDPDGTDVTWGALAGLTLSAGLVTLYTGYARSRVSISAPVAGVGAAALPVVVEVLSGNEDLSGQASVGIALGLVAIGFVSASSSTGEGAVLPSIAFGLGGAAGIGLFFVCLARTSDDSELWPLVTARASGALVLALGLLLVKRPIRIEPAIRPTVIGVAALVTAGNTAFLVATRVGSTSVAAVVTSLFPAVTVFWAWFVFRERLTRVQLAGLAIALVAIGLIAAD